MMLKYWFSALISLHSQSNQINTVRSIAIFNSRRPISEKQMLFAQLDKLEGWGKKKT